MRRSSSKEPGSNFIRLGFQFSSVWFSLAHLLFDKMINIKKSVFKIENNNSLNSPYEQLIES